MKTVLIILSVLFSLNCFAQLEIIGADGKHYILDTAKARIKGITPAFAYYDPNDARTILFGVDLSSVTGANSQQSDANKKKDTLLIVLHDSTFVTSIQVHKDTSYISNTITHKDTVIIKNTTTIFSKDTVWEKAAKGNIQPQPDQLGVKGKTVYTFNDVPTNYAQWQLFVDGQIQSQKDYNLPGKKGYTLAGPNKISIPTITGGEVIHYVQLW